MTATLQLTRIAWWRQLRLDRQSCRHRAKVFYFYLYGFGRIPPLSVLPRFATIEVTEASSV
jgi:hypothetical protein